MIIPDGPTRTIRVASPPRRRLRVGRVAAAVLVVAVVAGGAAYGPGLVRGFFGPGGGERVVPVIRADATPVRVRPENPGGLTVPHQGISVLERGGEQPLTPTEPSLRPPPEPPLPPEDAPPARAVAVGPTETPLSAPISRPDGDAGAPDADPRVAAAPVRSVEPSPLSPLRPGEAAVPPTLRVEPSAEEGTELLIPRLEGRIEGSALPEDPFAAPVPAPDGPIPDAAPPRVATAPATADVRATPMEAPPEALVAEVPPPQVAALPDVSPEPAGQPAQPAAEGGFGAQVAALGAAESIEAEWRRLQTRFPDLLGAQAMTTRSVDVNGQTFHRIMAGPMLRTEAEALCGALRSRGADCILREL